VKKVETGIYLNGNPNFIKLTDTNIEEVVDKIHETMVDDIHTHVLQAIQNLNWKVEEIKNFEYNPDKYKSFQEEVLKLMDVEARVEAYKEEQLAKGHEPVKIDEPIVVIEPEKTPTLISVKKPKLVETDDFIEKLNNLRKGETIIETISKYKKQVDEIRSTLKNPVPVKTLPEPIPEVENKHKTRINELRGTAESLANDFIASMTALETDIKEAIDETPKEVLDDLGYHSVEDVTQDIKLNTSYEK